MENTAILAQAPAALHPWWFALILCFGLRVLLNNNQSIKLYNVP